MKNTPRKRRGKHRVHMTDDGTTYEYDPMDLLYGIGSGRIRANAGASAERVAAALLLNVWREHPQMGPLLGGLTVDTLIESAGELVAAGALTQTGFVLPPEFN